MTIIELVRQPLQNGKVAFIADVDLRYVDVSSPVTLAATITGFSGFSDSPQTEERIGVFVEVGGLTVYSNSQARVIQTVFVGGLQYKISTLDINVNLSGYLKTATNFKVYMYAGTGITPQIHSVTGHGNITYNPLDTPRYDLPVIPEVTPIIQTPIDNTKPLIEPNTNNQLNEPLEQNLNPLLILGGLVAAAVILK